MPRESSRSNTRQKFGAAATLTVVGGSLVVNGTPVQALSPIVTSLADTVDAGDGQTTLREALYAVNGQLGTHTITFASGLSGVIDVTENGTLIVPNVKLTLTGPGNDQITLRNDNGTILYLYGTTATKTVSGLTLDGAGMHGVTVHDAGLITLDNITVTNSTDAGLLVTNGGNVVLQNSTISESGAEGIRVLGTTATGNVDRLTLEGTSLYGNATEGIDAIRIDKVTITDSAISNQANGTAVSMVGNQASATLAITRSTISGNTSPGLSAVSVYKGNTTIENSTVSGNNGVGAMLFKTGNVDISHSTLSGNTGSGAVINLLGSASDAILDHSIVSANGPLATINVGNSGAQQANWSLLGIDVTTQFDSSASANNVETNDPKLGPLIENGGGTRTMLPATDSPAIDHGNPSVVGQPATDQTGIARVVGTIDIGAVERETNGLQVTTVGGALNDDKTSFSEAIAVANSNSDLSEVTFAPGVSGTISLQDPTVVTADAIVSGPGAANITVTAPTYDAIVLEGSGLDLSISDITIADSLRGVVTTAAPTGTLTLDHVVVSGSDYQGVFAANLNSVTISDSTLTSNSDVGASIVDSPATLTRVQITQNGNVDSIGGGVRLGGASDALIELSTITGNRGQSGAGIRVESGDLTVRGSTISGNTASAAGSNVAPHKGVGGGIGVFDGAGTVVIDDTTIATNTADVAGGGIAILGNPSATPGLTMTRSTVSGNNATGSGGGVQITDVDAVIRSSTVAANSAATGASGLSVTAGDLSVAHSTIAANTTTSGAAGILSSSANVTLDHTILAGNQNDDFVASGASTAIGAFSLVGTGSRPEFSGSTNIGTANAQIGALANNGGATLTMLPSATSPAVDSGNPSIVGAPATDQRGAARIIDTIDIGAVEIPEVLTTGLIDISPVAVSVDEGSGTLTLTVQRTGGSLGAASVDVRSAMGSATAADFTALETTLSWADGDTTSRSVVLDITPDTLVESDETLTVNLSRFIGAAAGSATTSTITIVDNDEVGVIGISPAVVSITETGGSIGLVLTRSGGSDGAASVSIGTSNGSAVVGADFTAPATSVSWAAGQSGPRAITIPIVNDVLVEGSETFSVRLSSFVGSTAGAVTSSTVTILDDENPGVINLGPATISIGESGANAVVTLTRSGGSDGTATAQVTTLGGTAIKGSDFTEPSTVVSWAPGDTAAKTIRIPINDDSTVEIDETFTVNLANVTVAARGAATTSTVTIVDNDAVGVIAIDPSAVSVNEAAGSVSLTVTRSGGSDGAASVTASTTGGSAVGSSDYATTSTTFSWADGQSDAKRITIPIINDTSPEPDEQFSVTLSNAAGSALGGVRTSVVTISANDSPVSQPGSIAISPAAVSIPEDGGSVSLTVTRSGGSDGAASVDIAAVAGTATASDYSSANSTLTWANGVAGDKTVTIAINDDNVNEADEAFDVRISNPTTAALGAATSSTITIVDNDDRGLIELSPALVRIAESGSSVAFSVTRSGGSDGAASVRVRTSNGTAVSTDYTAIDQTLQWAAGETGPKVIVIPVNNDPLAETDEQFSVALSNVIGSALGAGTSSTVTIIDDDSVGVIDLGPASITVDESGAKATVTVTRSGGNAGRATATLSTATGTASDGGDYTGLSTLVEWSDGQEGAQTVDITITDDAIDEPDETFTVSLTNPVGARFGVATSTVTIVDNDTVVEPERESFVTPVAPARIVDTRTAGVTVDGRFAKTGRISAGQTLAVDVGGRGGVPADASAVVVNVTSVRGVGVGYLTVHPCLPNTPGASSVNYDGSNTPNEIIAGLSSLGQLCVFSSVDTDVLIDAVGYIANDSAYQPLPPARILETRTGAQTVDGKASGGGPLAAGGTFELDVRGRAGVSADATAVVINVTSIKSANNGFVTVHPCLGNKPGASSLNYTAGSNRANEIIAQLSAKGTICLFASSETGLLVDVVGDLTPETGYTPVAPSRVVDSRSNGETVDGRQNRIGRQADGAKLIVDVAGRANVPPDARAVVVNLTAVRPSGTGFFTTFDCGSVPNASSLNYASENVANEIVVELNEAGQFCVFTAREADMLIDVVGYL